MADTKKVSRKRLRRNSGASVGKRRIAKRGSEGETIAPSEEKRNRVAITATERFLKSGIKLKDIYGVLER